MSNEYKEWLLDNAIDILFEKYPEMAKITYTNHNREGIYLGGYTKYVDDEPRLFFIKYEDWSIRELK